MPVAGADLVRFIRLLNQSRYAAELTKEQARAVRDIVACRTEKLDGHLEECPHCNFSRGSYNSCRNRHCPKCQILTQERWAEAQEATFRYHDRADRNATKHRKLPGPEFAKLFLQHVLPPRFVRIRHVGILAVRRRGDLARCRELLHAPPPTPLSKDASWVETYERLFGSNPLRCPKCKVKVGILVVTRVLPPMRA